MLASLLLVVLKTPQTAALLIGVLRVRGLKVLECASDVIHISNRGDFMRIPLKTLEREAQWSHPHRYSALDGVSYENAGDVLYDVRCMVLQ
jgi:hypothetical protein